MIYEDVFVEPYYKLYAQTKPSKSCFETLPKLMNPYHCYSTSICTSKQRFSQL